MSLLMNMKIDGVIGDAKSYAHKGWCDVISWNWGMTSTRKTSPVTDTDKTSLNELSIVKLIGADSAGIRMLYAEGKVIPFVDFSIMPVVAKRTVQTKYVDIRMEDVVIKSIVTGGSIEDNEFKEHITLLFDRVRFEYSLDPVRKAESDDSEDIESEFSWNVSSGSEWKN